MRIDYLLNGVDFRDYGIEVIEAAGLFDDLPIKDRVEESYVGQHGVLIDRSTPLFDKRDIRLAIRVYDVEGNAEENYATFRGLFDTSIPLRLTFWVNGRRREYDVDWGGESERTYYNSDRGFTVTIRLIESAPIKNVYTLIGNASITLAAKTSGAVQPPVLVSWGDGSFVLSRNATLTHTYTDGYDRHYIILSGKMNEVTVTTLHDLVEEVTH